MIDDMTMRKLSPKTQTGYLRAVTRLTRFLGAVLRMRRMPKTYDDFNCIW